jgi:hypothetical protein
MMNDDVGIAFELTLLTFNIKWEVCSVLDSFLSFSRRYEETKTHNIISLMSNPTFKSFHLVSSIICHEQVGLLLKIMIGSFCILLKCHYHLNPLVEFLNDFLDQKNIEDYNLELFLQIASTIELIEKLVNIKLLTFKQY